MATTVTEIKKDVLKQDIIEGQPCVFSYGSSKELVFGIVVESRVRVKAAFAYPEVAHVNGKWVRTGTYNTRTEWTDAGRLVMITEERLYELLDGPTLMAMATIMGQVRDEVAKVEARKQRKRLKEAKVNV